MNHIKLYALPESQPWTLERFLEEIKTTCKCAAGDLHRVSAMIEDAVEDLIGLASYVEEMSVTFSSLPGGTVPAEIVKVGSEASLTTRTYPVTIQMEQPDGTTIQPGMAGKATARVRLPDNWAESGVEVPSASVFSPDGEGADNTVIWVINDETNTVSSKPVNVVSVGARGLMVQGLDAGDRIVIAGAKVITEGQEVRIETP